MATWIYNNDILRKHAIAREFLSTLNKVSNDDYPNTDYFDTNIECLDLDSYEQNRKGPTGKTVDAVIGISDCENKKVKNPRLLCVELRMGYESVRNFSSAFADKVTHSRELLGGQIPIESKSLFVFRDALAPQAESWIKRRTYANTTYKNIESCGVSDFGSRIKSFDDLPYKPLNDEEDIRKIFTELDEKKNWSAFIKQMKDYCELTLKYRYHNPFEYDYMTRLLNGIWTKFRSEHAAFDNDDDEINAEIVEDSYDYLLNKI